MRILPSRLSADTPENPPIDFDQMERDMREQIENNLRRPGSEPIQRMAAPKPHTSLQIIAQSIIALTWSEAVAMGKAIQAKGTDGNNAGDLTAAIQAWAKEWETFES